MASNHVVGTSGLFIHFADGTWGFFGPSVRDDDDDEEDIGRDDEDFIGDVPVDCLKKSNTPAEFVSGIRIGPFDEKWVKETLGDPSDQSKFPKPFLFQKELHSSNLVSFNRITQNSKDTLNRIYRDLFGLLRLLVLIPYTSGNDFVARFVHSVLVHAENHIHTLTHKFVRSEPVYLPRTRLDLKGVCVNQIICGIRPGNWENNFQLRLNSPNEFEILPNEDNPFLMFCRQYYNEVIFNDSFHNWVLAVHKYYEQWNVEINADWGNAKYVEDLREAALESKSIAGRSGPYVADGIRGVRFPDFPPGFDPELYSGPLLNETAGRHSP